jgi:hypothetical protein
MAGAQLLCTHLHFDIEHCGTECWAGYSHGRPVLADVSNVDEGLQVNPPHSSTWTRRPDAFLHLVSQSAVVGVPVVPFRVVQCF